MKSRIIIRIIVYSLLSVLIFYRLKDFIFAGKRYSDIEIDSLKFAMVRIINNERQDNGIPPVSYDSVAAMSAQYHANEMKNHGFFSHYSIDGTPPYVRYSFRNGGTYAIGENVALGINYKILKIGSIKIKGGIDIKSTIAKLNRDMYMEKPPHDGHRKTILNKHYNGVGIGIAYSDTLVFYVETFTGNLIKFLNKIPDTTIAGNFMDIYGQILYDSLDLVSIEVFYDSITDSLKSGETFFYDERNTYSYSDDADLYLPGNASTMSLNNTNNIINSEESEFYGSIYTERKGYYTIVPILSDGKELFEGANVSFFAK